MTDTPPQSTRLATQMLALVQLRWEEPHPHQGHADLSLFTDQGEFVTRLTPLGMQQLRSCLNTSLGAIGVVDDFMESPGFRVPGAIKSTEETDTYFDQQYKSNVLKALGVLMIRANLLDHGLIALLGTLSGANILQASNLYYASTNMKSRLDQIRSLADATPLTNLVKETIKKALIRVKNVTDRRNDLFHAQWTFRNGNHRAMVRKPNNKEKFIEITVTEKMVFLLAEDYHTASEFLNAAWQMANDVLAAARISSGNPLSMKPSS